MGTRLTMALMLRNSLLRVARTPAIRSMAQPAKRMMATEAMPEAENVAMQRLYPMYRTSWFGSPGGNNSCEATKKTWVIVEVSAVRSHWWRLPDLLHALHASSLLLSRCIPLEDEPRQRDDRELQDGGELEGQCLPQDVAHQEQPRGSFPVSTLLQRQVLHCWAGNVKSVGKVRARSVKVLLSVPQE